VRSIYPAIRAQPFVGNVVYDLGMGVFHWADVALCGLDNREARVAVNASCLRVGRPWIDGAIERLGGVARLFLPTSGACYECTMSETDWQMLQARRSCALLSRKDVEAGHTPTTATISSIVAGFQCQEMLKYLHDLPVEGGTGVVINGQVNDVYAVSYPRKEDCMAHETLDEIVPLPHRSDGVTMAELLARARSDLGGEATLELSREILHELECTPCNEREPVFLSLGKVTEDDARCARCGEVRFPHLLHSVDGTEDFLGRSPADIGLPPFDILVGRSGSRAIGYLMAGDERDVLGDLPAL
jgi:adenylyltransferase/sulfurtransferase